MNKDKYFDFPRRKLGISTEQTIPVVEPHPDDGILSMGGYLYDRYLKGDKLISTVLFMEENEIGLTRSRENEYVWKTILEGECCFHNAPDKDLIINDSRQLRINREVKELLTGVCTHLTKVIEIYKPDIIFFPIGIGEHSHHIITNLCFRMVKPRITSSQFMFYEDYPYADYSRITYSRPLYRMRSQFNIEKEYQDIEETLRYKAGLVMAYSSQHQMGFDEIMSNLQVYGEAIGYEGALDGRLSNGIVICERVRRLKDN